MDELKARYQTEEQLEIHEEIGRGGYGKVYRAHHLRLDTPVAVKVMNEQVQAMPSVVKLFAREARVMARIDHPNVLRVFDYGDGPEGPYIVTEWMSGGAIKSAGDETRLRAIASATASGLQALHEAQILHRDIKPANVFSRDDGRIKLADLGVALAPENHSDRAQFVGTIPYMAPELFDDPPGYGPASDIYALGVSLYQLWSGKLPYAATQITELVELIRKAWAPPLPSLRGGLSASFVRLLTAMMERHPESRPSTAEVVRELTSSPIVARGSLEPTELPRAPHAVAIGTPAPGGHLLRINAWVCTQEIYRGKVWNTFLAHHAETSRQARLGRLLSEWMMPAAAMVEAAKRSSQWSHPGLVSMLDWGTFEDRPYFVSGAIGLRILDLAQVQGAMSEVDGLAFVEQLAAALAYVHDRGFVFQMVDPSAIGSRPSGTGWMLDWPAFAMPIGAPATGATRYLSPFAAPEAPTSPTFDPATDVFGLGTSLAFVLTGSQAWPDALASTTTAATRALLSALRHSDPAARPTAIQARDWAKAIRERLEPIGGHSVWSPLT